MRFLRQSMIGLFLAAVTLGLLVYAGTLISGAVRILFGLVVPGVVAPAGQRLLHQPPARLARRSVTLTSRQRVWQPAAASHR